MILAYGGGTYVYIGATECLGRVNQLSGALSMRLQLLSLFAFFVGAVAIGLVLLDHEHCVAEGADAHAGHNHG